MTDPRKYYDTFEEFQKHNAGESGSLLSYTHYLRARLERAHEALEAWSDELNLLPFSMTPHENKVGALIIKYRLGAFQFPGDGARAVIQYGLGQQDPDPSTKVQSEEGMTDGD